MRLLSLTEFFPSDADNLTGGVESRMWHVMRRLAARHTVTVLCSHQPGSPREEVIDGVRVKRVGPTFGYTTGGALPQRIGFMLAISWHGRKIPCDVVEGSSFLTHPSAYYVAQYHGVPAIAWVADMWSRDWTTHFGLLGFPAWALEHFALTRPWSGFVPISHVVGRKIRRLGQSLRRIYVVPCGVDSKEFIGRPQKKEKHLLLWAGRFVGYKKPFLFLDAVSQLRATFPKMRAVMVGHGPLRKRIEEECAKLSLRDVVTILSNVPRRDFVRLLSKACIFVQTSTVEGFGIVVIEALAAGTPVVLPNLPIYHETTQGKGVTFFRSDHSESLVHAVQVLLHHPSRRQRLQKAGRAHAQNFSWKIIAEQTEKVYERIRHMNY